MSYSNNAEDDANARRVFCCLNDVHPCRFRRERIDTTTSKLLGAMYLLTCSVLCSKAVNLAIKYSRVATASFPWNQQMRLYFTYLVFFSLLVYVFNLHAFYFAVCITIIRTYLCTAEMKRIQRLAKFKGNYRFK